MWDRHDPRDDDRDRCNAWDRDLGGRGSTSDRDRDRDPRDVFTTDLDPPRGSERRPVRERDRLYEIDGGESRALATIGAFGSSPRAIRTTSRTTHGTCSEASSTFEKEGLIRTSALSSACSGVAMTPPTRC
jgi:hypothetical protein